MAILARTATIVFFQEMNFRAPSSYEMTQSHGLRFKLHSPPPDLSPSLSSLMVILNRKTIRMKNEANFASKVAVVFSNGLWAGVFNPPFLLASALFPYPRKYFA
jgi:hypothetical protein